jgi:hypothetical protein
MTNDEFRTALDELRRDWGSVSVDPAHPGIMRAANDPLTGILAGRRAPVIAEIINRALAE